MKRDFIELPCLTKNNKDLGFHSINVANILYTREWIENTPITKTNKSKSVIYIIGGKDIIINLPLHELIAILKEDE